MMAGLKETAPYQQPTRCSCVVVTVLCFHVHLFFGDCRREHHYLQSIRLMLPRVSGVRVPSPPPPESSTEFSGAGVLQEKRNGAGQARAFSYVYVEGVDVFHQTG